MSEPHDEEIEALLRRQFEGAVADDGFSERVMQRLPPRRRRHGWPLWLGVLAGAAACWLCLAGAPLLHAGWRAWLHGEWSPSVIGAWLAMVCLAWLALGWGLAESRDR
ncbi:DUF5056 domain-containing protein [Dyella agri]|uniref:DUF5056 domain-containing protein n=1 Tax=Dyella agri TaxID=1926869 RepID=A0ABW8KH09_9GAMM